MLPAIQNRYATLYGESFEQVCAANRYLRKIDTIRRSGRFSELLPERRTLRLRADSAAEKAVKLIRVHGVLNARDCLADHHQLFDLLRHIDTVDGIAALLACTDYWLRQFTRQAEQQTECVAIAAGIVRAGTASYISMTPHRIEASKLMHSPKTFTR